MIFLCPWACPDEKCPQRNSLQKGTKCPICGTDALELGFFDLKLLLEEKVRLHETNAPPKGEDFFGREEPAPVRTKTPERCTQDCQSDHETISLLKTIVKQNQAIIKQNERICTLVENHGKKS